MRLAALLHAGAALAACQPAAGEVAEDLPPVVPGPVTAAAVIEGLYRVAGIGGVDLSDSSEGFAVEITADEIGIVARCAASTWSWRFEDGRLLTEPSQPRHGPCRRMSTEAERALDSAFDGPLTVTRTEANGLLFESATGSITLFSQ